MYEAILESSLKNLRELPTPIPDKGGLAGITTEYMAADRAMFQGDNLHYPMGTTYLKYGVLGVAERAEAAAETAEGAQKDLLLAIGKVYREIGAYYGRYADAIGAVAGEDARLRRVSENLRALSCRAPEHFDEAVQSIYLMWKLRFLSNSCGDIGRLDVRLQRFFEKDIAAGYLTEEDAVEILCRLWEMLNEAGTGDTLTNVMVGGRNVDGSDAGSRISVLILEATRRCGLPDPHVNVRVHPNLSKDIWEKMLEVQLLGGGQAAVFNDEVIIPSLMRYGISEELACTYTNDGCTEVMLDGYSAIEFNHIDVVAVFELAFNNGDWAPRIDRKKTQYWNHAGDWFFAVPDAEPGLPSGKVEECTDFEEFYRQFLEQYRFQVRNRACKLRTTYENRMAGAETSVLLNGTFDSILESGKDVLRGGLPFEEYMIFSGSIPTAADCLVAVKKLVFEEKKYTVAQVKEAIRVNFEGYEAMRREMLAAPKFGNDVDEVDLLAADIAEKFCDWIDEYRKETGFVILPALYGWRFVTEAYGIAATPDGRRYADPIAEHYCATPGRAVKGPTAIIRSVAKAKNAISRAAGNTPFHLSLPRNLGENERVVLDGINRAVIESGLSFVGIGIYDVNVLREAQKHPEQYKDVIVRVWGYSARFVELCVDLQEHVISRICSEG